jgi:hypothetical protein
MKLDMLTLWDSYQRDVLPPTASEVQRTETRRAFYAGAAAMFGAMIAATDTPGPDATDADVACVDALVAEVKEFFVLVEKGLA